MDNITITVKVPFGGDRTVTTQPLVTVGELTETIMATCQTESFRGIPQCIVHSGRILPEVSTLQDAGVSNGAVLHLMRRPRDETRIPGRTPSGQPRSGSQSDTDRPHSQDHDQHDHDHEHPHHHEGEHHIHTNVIIGHIAVDGRIRYSDAHDMLLSVLHAIGFSTRAVRSAAAVAAAIAVATQSAEERGGASRTVLQNAWQATRRLQEQLSRETFAFSPGPVSTVHAEAPRIANRQPTLTTSSTTTQPAEGSASPAKDSVSAQGELEQSRTPQDAPMPIREGAPASEPQILPSNPTELLPEDPPPTQEGETDLQASGRAADRLLPVLADLMEVSASRLRNAPSLVDLESNRLEAAETLTEQMGSVASVVTFVTTLLSTLLPDPDDLRTTNVGNRGGNTEGTHEQRREGDTGANARTAPNASDGSVDDSSGTGSSRQETPQTERTQNVASNGPSGGARAQNVSSGGSAVRSGSQGLGMFPARTSQRNQGPAGSHRRVRRSGRVRVSSSQAANADFLIRVLSYYFCSLSEGSIPTGSGPPEVDGQTAISVLDGLYGTNSTARPVNMFLRVIYFGMQKLTPLQFHEICRGNMVPLAAIRQDLWEEISRVVRRRHGPGIEVGEVEELFVDHICEVLHEFVHVLESADEANEDGVFSPGPEDFCHQIMHTIQRKTEIFADILSVRRSEEEFSGRMSRWVQGAVGEILLAIAMELEMQWDSLLSSFRRAAYEIGKRVVGSQFSVIFPYVTNVFANRAKQLYQRSASRHPEARHSHADTSSGHAGTNGELDHCDCGPCCERNQTMLDEDTVSRSHESSDHDLDVECAHDETDSDMPELGEDDSGDDFDDDYESTDDSYEGDPLKTDSRSTDRKAMSPNLDETELHELAEELEAESKQAEISKEAEGELEEIDLDAMAGELADEVVTSIAKSSATSFSASKPNKLPTGPNKRMAAMAAGERANNFGTSSVNPALAMPGSSLSSSISRPAFSAAAVSRGGSSGSTSSLKNDFEQVLGAQDGLKWKGVLESDQARVLERRYGPLSRGYSGDTSVAQPLDSKRGSDLATEAVREAAKKAKLSPERAREMERVASESGSQYMREMERAIGSRLRSDPDFNRQSFPRAAKRFLPKGS